METPEYTIVTAWYDVREREDHPYKENQENRFFCSTNTYFKSAEPFFNKPFPMVIFTEPRFEKMIKDARPPALHHLTKFMFKPYEDYQLLDTYLEKHKIHKIDNLTQEKFTGLYKFIVNQKVNFVKETILMNPFSTEKFAWMDLRLHCVYDMDMEECDQVFSTLDPNRVKLMQMAYTPSHEVAYRNVFYWVTRGKVAAGFFAGYKAPLLKFCELCQTEFIESLNQDLTPTDEMIYAYIVGKNYDLFDPYTGDYPQCIQNIMRTCSSTHLCLNFLNKAIEDSNDYYIWKTADNLRKGYKENRFQLNADNLFKIWYYNCVANFRLGHHDNCKILLKELKDLAIQYPDIMSSLKLVENDMKPMLETTDFFL